MKNIFQGTFTALITPFKSDKEEISSVDFKAFDKLIENQIKNGVEGIIVCSTTGEGATLTAKEKAAIITRAVETAKGRIAVIANTGTCETEETYNFSTIAKEHGADGIMLIAPYYVKPTQEGIFEHFHLVASRLPDIPIMIYNCPSRTGVNIHPETLLRLTEACKNVMAVKEASGDIEQIQHIIKFAPDHFNVLSGDDSLALAVIALGGKGCVSVISNYAPKQFSDLVRFALKGKIKEARDIHYHLLEMMDLNFIESNPIPVKFIMASLGYIKDEIRMPLLPLNNDFRKLIKDSLKLAGIKK
jgi:4-hydroxy-tetrahydrodipicolinate synthase